MHISASREESALPMAAQPQPLATPEIQPGMNRVLFLLGLSVLINYIDRSNLSIAAPLIKDELGISASQLGTLLSAFFYTYALLQIPAGWLVDRFDVKWVFALGLFIWSAATAVTGVLHGFVALLAIRVVLGIGESVAFPAYGKILGGHFRCAGRRRELRWALRMAPVLRCSGPGRIAMARAMVGMDAAQSTRFAPHIGSACRNSSHPEAAVGVGNVRLPIQF